MIATKISIQKRLLNMVLTGQTSSHELLVTQFLNHSLVNPLACLKDMKLEFFLRNAHVRLIISSILVQTHKEGKELLPDKILQLSLITSATIAHNSKIRGKRGI